MEEIYIESLPPEENMRRDEEALLSLESDRLSGPIFRLYRWDRVCLSLGHFQKEKTGIGLPTVRRPTGGGALLHGWDVSFSLVDLRERWGHSPSRIYKKIATLFMESFSELGVEVRLERFRGRYIDNFFCFWIPTLGELSWKGRKAVSMAMRTLRRSFLVHGSLYTDFDYRKASQMLGIPEDTLRRRIVSIRELGLDDRYLLKILRDKFSSAMRQGGRV